MLDDGDPDTFVASRQNPPDGSGLVPASSEVFNADSIHRAGYSIVVWTVNDTEKMQSLIDHGVDGIISDRPDLLREVVMTYDADKDGNPDFLDTDGLIDVNLFDAQGHRGGRNLRPENTLAAMEVALDNLMTTLETDTGITAGGLPVLNHDPYINASKCRCQDGQPYGHDDEVLIKNLTAAEIQSTFICDKLLPGRPEQTNDRALSPVSVAFAAANGLMDPYVMPTLPQLFDFVDFYREYYQNGDGSNHPDAEKRWKNARRVHFNIETKINPRKDVDAKGNVFANRTVAPEVFAQPIADTIIGNGLQDRVDIQSFDFRTRISSKPLNKRNLHERCNLGARYRWGIESNILVEKRCGYQLDIADARKSS